MTCIAEVIITRLLLTLVAVVFAMKMFPNSIYPMGAGILFLSYIFYHIFLHKPTVISVFGDDINEIEFMKLSLLY